jgi:hypothetical protein
LLAIMADLQDAPAPAGPAGTSATILAVPVVETLTAGHLVDVEMEGQSDDDQPASASAPAVVPAGPTLHLDPLFSAAENDVVLLSADGKRLGFRRVFLESASVVFESVGLIAGQGADCAGGKLPVIPLAEAAETLATLLLYLHPRAPDPEIKSYEQMERSVDLLRCQQSASS